MATLFEDLPSGRRASYSSHSDFRRGLAHTRMLKTPQADPEPSAPVSHSSTTQGVDFEVPSTLGNSGPLAQAATAERENRKRDFFTHLSGFLSREGSGPVQTIDQWEGLMQSIPVSRDGLEGFIGEITEKFAPESVKREMAERTNLQGEDRLVRGRIANAEARIRESGRNDLMVDPGSGSVVAKPPSMENVGNETLRAMPLDAQLEIRKKYINALGSEGGQLVTSEIERQFGNPLVTNAPTDLPGGMSIEKREALIARMRNASPEEVAKALNDMPELRDILDQTGVLESNGKRTNFFDPGPLSADTQIEGTNVTPAAQAAAKEEGPSVPTGPSSEVLARAEKAVRGRTLRSQRSGPAAFVASRRAQPVTIEDIEKKVLRSAVEMIEKATDVRLPRLTGKPRRQRDHKANIKLLKEQITKESDITREEADQIVESIIDRERQRLIQVEVQKEAERIQAREARAQKRSSVREGRTKRLRELIP